MLVCMHCLFKKTTMTAAAQLLIIGLSDRCQHRVQLRDDKPLTAHNLPLTTAAALPTLWD